METIKIWKMMDNLCIKIKKESNWKKGQHKTGKCNCPKCKNILYWIIHRDGHIWATCKTKDCINFME